MADADSEHRAKPDNIVSRSQKFLSFVSEKVWLLGAAPFVIIGVIWILRILYAPGGFDFFNSDVGSRDSSTIRTIVATPQGTKVTFSCPYTTQWEYGKITITDRVGRIIYDGTGYTDHGRSADLSRQTFYGDNISVKITEEASC